MTQRRPIKRDGLYSAFNAMVQAAERAHFDLDDSAAQALLQPVSAAIAVATRQAIITEKKKALADKKRRLATITSSVAEDEQEISELEKAELERAPE